MHAYVAQRSWTVVTEVRDVSSWALQRPQHKQSLQAARRPQIDAVLVWRLDRWRRSVADLMVTLQELHELGVGFVSLTEALDLTTPTGAPWPGCSPCSLSSNGKFSVSVCVRGLPRHVNKGSRMAGQRWRGAKPHRSVSRSRAVSARVQSPASWPLGAHRCEEFLRADEGLTERSACTCQGMHLPLSAAAQGKATGHRNIVDAGGSMGWLATAGGRTVCNDRHLLPTGLQSC